MNRAFAALAAAALASCSAPESYRVDPPAPGAWTSLPLRFENDLPFVEIVAGGKRLPVMFDLGAGATIWLEPEAAEAGGARFTGDSSTFSDAFGNRHTCRGYVLPECRLGDFTLRDVEGRENSAAHSLLGWRLLKPFRILIDYPGNRIVLLSGAVLPADVHPENWTRVPFRATQSGLITDATCDGRPIELVWDTGANRSILKEGRADESLIERKDGLRTFTTKSFLLAGRDFGPTDFVILDLREPPGDGLVGHGFFAAHRVLIDWEAGEMAVE